MKLITHNMLSSKCIKNVKVGFPLKIVASEIKETKVDYDSEMVKRLVQRLDWSAFREAAQTLKCGESLPEELPEDYENNPDLLQTIHHSLLEVEVVNGELECPETGRKFPIANGIPNMLLNEDEV